jgi:hypothetical protein
MSKQIIKPLVPINKVKRCVADFLPCPYSEKPFMMLITAKVGSGKSVFISNLLRLPQYYFRKFNKVFFCSSNVNDEGEVIDPAFSLIEFDEENVYDDFNPVIFADIRKKIKDDPDFEKNQYLLVIDDLALALKDKEIQKQIARHRHMHLSIIITCQRLKMVPPLVRNNISHCVLFKTLNKQEIEYLNEVVNIDKDIFEKILKYGTKDKYDFLFIDIDRLRFIKNFTEEIDIKDEDNS